MDDLALLRQYADSNSEEAFREVVQRHIAVVYSAARRQVGEAAAADVSQAVFLLLARKAGKLRSNTILTAWLLTTTRFVTRTMLRSEARRKHWEQEAATMSFHNPSTEVQVAWEKVQPLLDEALAALPQAERGLVALRFFENKSHAEIATTLGLSEDVSKKRLSRAMEKLRGFFSKRGVTLGGVVLFAAISENAVQAAPAGLASQIASASSVGASVTAAALVKAALKLMTWTKIKIIGASVAIGLAVASVPIALTLSAADSNVTTPNGRDVKLERYEFKAVPVRYSYPSSGPRPALSVTSPNFPGEPVLSAEFSWKAGPTQPAMDGLRVVAADDSGNEFDPVGQEMELNMEHAGGRAYWVTGVEAFPRRGKQVHLRLLNDGKVLADFKIPNPAPGPHPEWTAQPMPVKATDRDLEVALSEFRTGRLTNSLKRTDARTECVFKFRDNNRDTTNWRLARLEVADATGNHWAPGMWAGGGDPYQAKVENGSVRINFISALWPGESAWKLRTEFKRVAEFQENELLHLTKIRIPDAKELIEPRTRHEWNGASVELSGLLGPDMDAYTINLGPNASMEERLHRVRLMNAERNRGCVTVVLAGEILSRKRRLTFVGATDERGNPIELVRTGEPAAVAATRNQGYWCALRPAAGARELNLVVAISEPRTVEFLAKPEQVKE